METVRAVLSLVLRQKHICVLEHEGEYEKRSSSGLPYSLDIPLP